jgi:ABC-type transporter Mla subunit MlaD
VNAIQCTPAQLAGLLSELADILDVAQGRMQQLADDFNSYAGVAKLVEETDGKVVASKPIQPAIESPVAETAKPLSADDLIAAFKRTAGAVGPEKAKSVLTNLGVAKVSEIPVNKRIEALQMLGSLS